MDFQAECEALRPVYGFVVRQRLGFVRVTVNHGGRALPRASLALRPLLLLLFFVVCLMRNRRRRIGAQLLLQLGQSFRLELSLSRTYPQFLLQNPIRAVFIPRVDAQNLPDIARRQNARPREPPSVAPLRRPPFRILSKIQLRHEFAHLRPARHVARKHPSLRRRRRRRPSRTHSLHVDTLVRQPLVHGVLALWMPRIRRAFRLGAFRRAWMRARRHVARRRRRRHPPRAVSRRLSSPCRRQCRCVERTGFTVARAMRATGTRMTDRRARVRVRRRRQHGCRYRRRWRRLARG